MTPDLAGAAAAGVLGLMIGSFLNVCIYRLPRGESIVWPASRCRHCAARLRWYDNVPVASYVWLGGRCRTCRQPISAAYPLVETATAVLFVVFFLQLGWQPLLVARLVLACVLVVLFTIDLELQLLPNRITLPGIAAGFLFSLFLPPGWLASLLGIALGGGILLAIAEAYYRVRGEEGLGMGDVKMLAMIGAFLGWQQVIVTLVLASLAGSVIGIGLIVLRRGDMKHALPFGTFLALGALVAALAGGPLVGWYLSFY